MNTISYKNFRKTISTNRGFAMLFSVLVSSLILSIGLSIFNLTIKELILSSLGRESQFAFYAADSGAECAIYWDFKGQNVFATSSSPRSPNPANPTCNSQPINITPSSTSGTSATTQFQFNLGPSNAYQVIVTVRKNDTAGYVQTVVDSRGYNTTDTTDPGRVERALRVSY